MQTQVQLCLHRWEYSGAYNRPKRYQLGLGLHLGRIRHYSFAIIALLSIWSFLDFDGFVKLLQLSRDCFLTFVWGLLLQLWPPWIVSFRLHTSVMLLQLCHLRFAG